METNSGSDGDGDVKSIQNSVEHIMENDIVANQSYVEENRRIDDESEEDEYEMTLDLDNAFSYNWEDEFFKKFDWLKTPEKKDVNEEALNAKYQLFMDACSMLQGNFNMINEKDPEEDPRRCDPRAQRWQLPDVALHVRG